VHLLPHGIGGAAVHKLKSVAWRPSDLAGYVPRKQLRQRLQLDACCWGTHTVLTVDTLLQARRSYLVLV